MNIRDVRQAEFAQIAVDNQLFGILYLCPRFGKIYTCINFLEDMGYPKVLIAYPDSKIKESWIKDLVARRYNGFDNITFTTHISLHKHLKEQYDLIILDELHLLSEAQIEVCKKLLEKHEKVIGLTGTMTEWTEKTLLEELGMPVIATYPIEKGIEEGIITDYEIEVVTVPLDTVVKTKNKKGKWKSEKETFDAYSWVINKIEKENYARSKADPTYKKKDTFSLRLHRMRIIQKSLAKAKKTKELLKRYKDERILVFCGLTAIADGLGCPVYHSKAGEQEIFDNFAIGKGNHLAVVKIGNTGVTYKPLNRVIVNYFDSNGENLAQKINRCMAMEYNNPDKKSHITIISSTEDVEQKWLEKALEFFDENKIKYL